MREGMTRVLGLFAKQPRPGHVKTRLAAATSPEWAAAVAAAFLEDTLDRVATIEARRVLAFAPSDAESYFAAIGRERFLLVAQGEGDLGQRMAAFFTGQRAHGPVVLLGTDSPTLPREFVAQAFEELDQADVVLGPATDGGYYLLGCRRPAPIFDGIDWSGPRVLAQTIERLSDPSWRVAVLPPWYDVDTLADWMMLRGHVHALERAGTDPCIPRTRHLLFPAP